MKKQTLFILSFVLFGLCQLPELAAADENRVYHTEMGPHTNFLPQEYDGYIQVSWSQRISYEQMEQIILEHSVGILEQSRYTARHDILGIDDLVITQHNIFKALANAVRSKKVYDVQFAATYVKSNVRLSSFDPFFSCRLEVLVATTDHEGPHLALKDCGNGDAYFINNDILVPLTELGIDIEVETNYMVR